MVTRCVSEIPVFVAKRPLDDDRRLCEQSLPPWGNGGDNDSIGYGGRRTNYGLRPNSRLTAAQNPQRAAMVIERTANLSSLPASPDRRRACGWFGQIDAEM